MAAVTNTFVSTSAVGNREELSDVVDMITPEDTPIYSMIPKGRVKSTFPEWETDTLAAPAANAQEEGDEYTYAAITPAVRVKNYTQIFRKDWIVSGTQDAIDNAGSVEKTKYQKLKKGKELRKDIEFAIVSNTASVGGSTRSFGSLPSWLTTNALRNSGSDGGYSQSTGLTVAASNGTLRAFTKALMDTNMENIYKSGGDLHTIVTSPYIKSVFVTFMSDSNVASFRHAAPSGQGNTLVGNVDVYEGPHGKVRIKPNRVMSTSADVARNVFFIDSEKLAIPALRKIHNDPNLAKTGDATKGVLIGEMTLCVKNEAGLGVVADVFGLTAST